MNDAGPTSPSPEIVGILLAGGLSRRMGGGDKGLRRLGGRTILDRVVERAQPQVTQLVLNANGDPKRFSSFELPVASDVVEGYPGPLGGVLTGMEWALANRPDCTWIATFPTDSPFFPRDLVMRLLQAVEEEAADLACAASADRVHPVFGLWPVRLSGSLRLALVEEGVRKVDAWTARYQRAVVPFDTAPFDPFFNVNRPEDLDRAALLLEGSGRSSL